MKQLAIDRLLETMSKYESDEWTKADYIHMLKHCAKMSVITEGYNIRNAYLDGMSKGTISTLKDQQLDYMSEIIEYMTRNFETR